MIRVPVVNQNGEPLMPTKSSRARKWVKEGKAVGKWSDVAIYYVQLLEPSGEETQPVIAGVDPGKSYAGIGVQSAKFTLARFHLILPFGRVKQRMEQRRMLRRSRRSRRINRKVSFNRRNHRQKRFSNRKQLFVPPSIKASRQLELRVVRELSKIFPLTAIGYERVRADVDRTKRKTAKSGKGFSPVMNGQLWAISQMEIIAPVFVREGWLPDGNGTSQIRKHLGLEKDKENKGEAKPETHAVDGVALACGYFVQYSRHITANTQGYLWKGEVDVTDSVFRIITRPGARFQELFENAIQEEYQTSAKQQAAKLQQIKIPKAQPSGLTEVEVTVKARLKQNFFRQTVLVNYNSRCCITGNPIPELLVASHILPWNDYPEHRLNPHNGLCLAHTHDAAFDKGLITFDEDYRLIISAYLASFLPDKTLERDFVAYRGHQMRSPDKFRPNPDFLQIHREEIFRGE